MPEQRELCSGHWRALVRSGWLLRLSLETTVYVSILWAVQAWLLRCGLWVPLTQTLIPFFRVIPGVAPILQQTCRLCYSPLSHVSVSQAPHLHCRSPFFHQIYIADKFDEMSPSLRVPLNSLHCLELTHYYYYYYYYYSFTVLSVRSSHLLP